MIAPYTMIWEEALNALKQTLPDYHFMIFFHNSQPFFEKDGVFYFEVSTANEKTLLETKYKPKVLDALRKAYEVLELPADPTALDVVYFSPVEAQEFKEGHSTNRARYEEPEPEPYYLPDSPENETDAQADEADEDLLSDEDGNAGIEYTEQANFVISADDSLPRENVLDEEYLPYDEQDALEEVLPTPPAEPADTAPAQMPQYSKPQPAPRPRQSVHAAPVSPENASLPLNPAHTFDSFVVGESNKFANAAAHAVAHSPGRIYNPLFLYGGVGLGKTHLMHAIGNEILRNYPDKKIVYVTSETFTNELISMIRSANSVDRRQEFRNKYRKADVLMIDDIQFIAGKDTTQDEFFHTFNELHADNKQIVISSDRPPKDLNQLEERMRSRFEWGVMADIQLPDYETRVAILQRKASERPDMLPMDNDVFYYMAEQQNVNIRSLEGALTRVNMYAQLHQANRVDLATAKGALQEIFRDKRQHTVTAEQVCKVVSEYFDVSEKELLGSKRTKDVAFARQVAMYVVRQLTDLSLVKIAEYFHKKDHTTVMHAERTVEKAMKEDANKKKEVDDVIARLRNT